MSHRYGRMEKRYCRGQFALCPLEGGCKGELKHISVVIPCYNNQRELELTLTGLNVQSYPLSLVEVIVVDGGSSPPLKELLSRFESYFDIIFIRQERRGYSVATARNIGIQQASGSIVICLDSDMLPVPELIEAHVRHLTNHEPAATIGYRRYIDASTITPELILTSFDTIYQFPDVPSASNDGKARDRRLPEFAYFDMHPAPYNCFHGCNVAFRKSDAIRVGLFDEEFNGHWGYEDIEFGYRLWRSGISLLLVPEALGFHQENSVLTLSDRLRDAAVNFELICRKIPGFREFRQSIGRVRTRE
jgi:chondroitin synthase